MMLIAILGVAFFVPRAYRLEVQGEEQMTGMNETPIPMNQTNGTTNGTSSEENNSNSTQREDHNFFSDWANIVNVMVEVSHWMRMISGTKTMAEEYFLQVGGRPSRPEKDGEEMGSPHYYLLFVPEFTRLLSMSIGGQRGMRMITQSR